MRKKGFSVPNLKTDIILGISIQCGLRNRPLNTCKGLKDACEVEEASFRYREQLNQKHQAGDGGGDHREDHERLDRLQPVWGRRSDKTCETR